MLTSQALAAFTLYLRANGRSAHTLRAYAGDLNRLPAMAEHTEGLTPLVMQRLVAGKAGKPATVNRLKAALRAFGEWLADGGLAPKNPAALLEIKRTDSVHHEALTDCERKRMLRELWTRKGCVAHRDAVMLEVLLSTGIRLAELVGLDIADVDLERKKLSVRVKGGHQEERFIPSDLVKILRAYLRERRRSGSESEALFLSGRQERLTARAVEYRFAHWLLWAGITRDGLTVHSTRHTFGTRLYRKTKDLVLVQKAMGHRTIAATRVYVHDDQAALEDAVNALKENFG